MNKFLPFLAFLFVLISCNPRTGDISDPSHKNEYAIDTRSGKNYRSTKSRHDKAGCYAKCLIPTDYGMEKEIFPIYTGTQFQDNKEIDTIEYVVPAHSKWVKKPDPNCRSANPNDCLVWCLVEEAEEVKQLVVVKDIQYSNEFMLKKFPESETGNEKIEWRAVICDDKANNDLIRDIQMALVDLGYELEAETGFSVFDDRTKAQLSQFQRDFALPIGNLDFETLDALGVSY